MKRNKNNSLFDPVLLRRSLRASFTKLDPRQMIKNPIMFTVEAVTFAMLLLIVRIAVTGDTSQGSLLYNLVIFAVLLLTVLFANFAEAIAEAMQSGAAAISDLVCANLYFITRLAFCGRHSGAEPLTVITSGSGHSTISVPCSRRRLTISESALISSSSSA